MQIRLTLEKGNHTVTAYFGYRITVDYGVAEDVLPFNISPRRGNRDSHHLFM